MKELWSAIKAKLSEIAPEIIENLNEGATDENLNLLEKTINAKLPESFKEFYKIHDGQSGGPGMFDCEEFLSIDRIIDEYSIWKKLLDQNKLQGTSNPDEGIKNNWWNSLWIPITYDGSGNHYCLDLDPSEEGHYGQIIRMWHDDSERTLEADSFLEWVTTYKENLESGQFVYSEEYYGIIDKDF